MYPMDDMKEKPKKKDGFTEEEFKQGFSQEPLCRHEGERQTVIMRRFRRDYPQS